MLLFVLLSRYFGQENIGKYSFALATGTILSTLADFGYTDYAVKALTRNLDRAKRILAGFLLIRIVLSLAMLAVLLVLANILEVPPSTRHVLILVGIYQLLFTYGQIFIAEIKAHEEMQHIAMLELLHRGIILLIAVGLFTMKQDFTVVVCAYPLGGIMYLATCIYVSRERYGKIILRCVLAECLLSMKEAGFFLVNNLFFQFYFRTAIFFLTFYLGEKAAGSYSMASKLLMAFGLFAYFFSSALYPPLAQAFQFEQERFIRLYRESLRLLVIWVIPIFFVIIQFSNQVTALLYGGGNEDAANVARVLALYFPLMCLNCYLQYVLFAMDRHKIMNAVHPIAVIISIMLNVVLIRKIGLIGAAYAAICVEGVILAIYIAIISKVVETRITIVSIGKPSAAGLFGGALFLALNNWTIFISVPIFFVGYFCGLWLSGGISMNDWKNLKGLVTSKNLA